MSCFELDFRFHTDPSALIGTDYFEFVPGPYTREHWKPGMRFIHEYTFCLIEEIFNKHIPGFDHFGIVEIPRPQWSPVLADLTRLVTDPAKADYRPASLPYGAALNLAGSFEPDRAQNQQALSGLVSELHDWLAQTLNFNDCISVLGM